MKIAIAQINTIVGDFEGNTRKIIDRIQQAKKGNVDLIVFPELVVCGNPPGDLLQNRWFLDRTMRAINEIQLHCTDIVVIIGSPSQNLMEGKQIFNSAYIIEHGQISATISQSTFSPFDLQHKNQYFSPGQEIKPIIVKGKKIGIVVGDDLSLDYSSMSEQITPVDILVQEGAELLINLSAKPFIGYFENRKNDIFSRVAFKSRTPIVYVNQVGANGELIFDGRSKVFNATGEMVLRCKAFEEDFQVFQTDHLGKMARIDQSFNLIENIYQALVLGIRDFFEKNGFKKAVLGLSGGIDSAVVACLAVKALGNQNVTGLLLPSEFSTQHSIDDALALAKKLKIEHHIVPIRDIYQVSNQLLSQLFNDNSFGLAQENLQARLRAVLLMAYSNKNGHILLNTGNKSEAAVGYSTLYGDSCGALAVIGDVYKTEIYELAQYINSLSGIIPSNILIKAPSAELRPGQKDSDSLPDYPILDKILHQFIEKQMSVEDLIDSGFDSETVRRVFAMIKEAEYKRRQSPFVLCISPKPLGLAFKLPTVWKYCD
ncbi:MAG TPA: NAD+ synthase [Salinivirgaceae bacterium]|nr:NAD+ synthase [Salinivirgaceae bacterium]